MIDLHSHTTASDGQHSPEELLSLARCAGVTTLAVTDHDTLAGLDRARAAADLEGLTLINGIELSAFVNGREVHILGHFVRRDDASLAQMDGVLRKDRNRRMQVMVEKMNGLGFPVSMDEVLAIAKDAQLGRPHLARVLVEKNFVASTKEAFDRFLADGRPGWADRFKIEAPKAIELIRNAGGVATVAHPGVSKVNLYELQQMKDAGLDGLEAFHSDHVPSLREKFLGWAKDLDLVPTSGSDFHGEKVAPGRHLGTASMDQTHLDRLRSRAAAA